MLLLASCMFRFNAGACERHRGDPLSCIERVLFFKTTIDRQLFLINGSVDNK